MVVELIKALASVRDGLTLIAFLSLVVLVAFRTKKVPELVFGLVRDKLTQQQFFVLLHRWTILGFAAFLALVGLAITSEVLNHLTLPGVLTVADLRAELEKAKASDDQKTHAEAEYRRAMEELSQRNFDGAITALKASIAEIPSLTAQEMLVYLNRQKGDFAAASKAWEGAVKLARQRGDTLALARLDKTGVPDTLPDVSGEHDLIGDSTPLPKGGDGYESAKVLPVGFYKCVDPCFAWFKLDLRAGQHLVVRFRSPSSGGLAGIAIYDTNGQSLKTAGDKPDTMRGNAGGPASIYQLDWTAAAGGWYFLRTNSDPGTVYRILVR